MELLHHVRLLPLAFMLGCAAVLSAVARSGDSERQWLAVLLTASCAASNLAWLSDSVENLAIMDGAIAALGLMLHLRDPASRWRRQFAHIAIFQVGLHLAYTMLGRDFGSGFSFIYDASFAGELWVVGATGGRNGLDWIRHLPLFRHVLAKPREA